ncbi:MAG: dTMP kinase [Pseudomonadota bacterium]
MTLRTVRGADCGRFIAFEGGEGAGKSTQAKMLAARLQENGISVDLTREPGGTQGAEAIRDLLLNPPSDTGWGPQAEALLFAASRSDHVAQRIGPALQSGTWVVCDRFVDSSRAYQGGAGGLGDDAICALHSFGSAGLRPDLTVLVSVNPERVRERLAARDGGVSDAIGGRGAEYHARVAAAFEALAKANPDSFAIVDGNAAPEAVHEAVLEVISTRFGDVFP